MESEEEGSTCIIHDINRFGDGDTGTVVFKEQEILKKDGSSAEEVGTMIFKNLPQEEVALDGTVVFKPLQPKALDSHVASGTEEQTNQSMSEEAKEKIAAMVDQGAEDDYSTGTVIIKNLPQEATKEEGDDVDKAGTVIFKEVKGGGEGLQAAEAAGDTGTFIFKDVAVASHIGKELEDEAAARAAATSEASQGPSSSSEASGAASGVQQAADESVTAPAATVLL